MNTQTISQEDDTRTSGEIEAEIRQTRGRMDATLDELGNRLTPKSLLNSAFDWWESQNSGGPGGGATAKAMVGLARQARRHPMPALLIGSGLVWLVADSAEDDVVTKDSQPTRRRNADLDFHDSNGMVREAEESTPEVVGAVERKANELGEKLHQTTEHISQKAHHALDKGKTTLQKFKHEAAEGYETGLRGFGRACDDYPLAVGVGFAALGIFAGLLIPRTHREDKLMGEQSDQLREETRDKAHELLETGKAVGHSVVQTVKDEAEKQGITGETVAAKVSEIADMSGEIFAKAKEEAIQTAEERNLTA